MADFKPLRLRQTVDAVGHIQVGALAQVLHAADKLARQAFRTSSGVNSVTSAATYGTFLGHRKTLFGLRLDFHFLRQDIIRLRR